MQFSALVTRWSRIVHIVNVFSHIIIVNVVTLRWARLVSVFERVNYRSLWSTQPGHPSVGRRSEYQSSIGWAGTVTLHWPCVTDNNDLSTYGLNSLWKGDEHYAYTLLRSMALLYTWHQLREREDYGGKMWREGEFWDKKRRQHLPF